MTGCLITVWNYNRPEQCFMADKAPLAVAKHLFRRIGSHLEPWSSLNDHGFI